MVAPKPTEQRLLDIGPAAWFRPEPVDPPANQVRVKAGIVYVSGHQIFDRFSGGDQLSAGFSTVAAGQRRYDLVYLDNLGQVQILQGTALPSATPDFEGAPGWDQGGTAGPLVPDQIVPVAWVRIDEAATVEVDAADIFQITAQVPLSREFDGYKIDKGLFGAAPTGTSDDVSALFAAETPGGNDTTRGVVTTPPLNFVDILDENNNELILTADGSQVYARVTESGGVWTLNYLAHSGGSEITVDVSTDITTSPTNLRLVGVPKVFGRNDPNRPLFPSSVSRLSDLAAADIPTATTTVQGKVIAAANSPNPPQAGSVNVAQNAGVPLGSGPFHTLNFPSGGAASPSPGVLDVPASAGPTGPTGPTGPIGPAGPTGSTIGLNEGPWQRSGLIFSFPSGSGSEVFSFPSTVRYFMVGFAYLEGPRGNTDRVEITSASKSGTQVTANWTVNDTGGGADWDWRIGCNAARD